MNGIEVTWRIRRQWPQVRVIALTAYNKKAYQRALNDAGADGFVLKTAEFSELLKLIRRVMSDGQRTTTNLLQVHRAETNSVLPLFMCKWR